MTTSSNENPPGSGRLPDASCSAAWEIVKKGKGGNYIRCTICHAAVKIVNPYTGGQFRRKHAKTCPPPNSVIRPETSALSPDLPENTEEKP